MGVRILTAYPRHSQRRDTQPKPLMIEIRHDDLEPRVLLSQKVLHRHLDIIEFDERGSRGIDARVGLFASRYAGVIFEGDDEGGDPAGSRAASTDCGGAVVCPDAVCDPFLLAIDDVEFPVWGLFGGGGEAGDVRTSYQSDLEGGSVRGTLRFGDGETHSLFSSEDGGKESLFLGWGAVVDDGWATDCIATA
jgi:hypothetical protein